MGRVSDPPRLVGRQRVHPARDDGSGARLPAVLPIEDRLVESRGVVNRSGTGAFLHPALRFQQFLDPRMLLATFAAH